MTVRLGLTGGVGTGKSTTAAMFAEEGIPVWSADAAVHRLYAPGGAGVAEIARLCPAAVGEGGVDRARLRAAIGEDPGLLPRIEAAIHPLVARDRAAFLDDAERRGERAALCEVPLLFETGIADEFDAIVVTAIDEAEQRRRVLSRPGMDDSAFATLRGRQMPQQDKIARADAVIDTATLEAARRQVKDVIGQLGRWRQNARDRS